MRHPGFKTSSVRIAMSALTICAFVTCEGQVQDKPSPASRNSFGWHSLPNTNLAFVCPKDDSLHGTSGCAAVIRAWGGAAADTKRNRLLVWGGGHNDYYGNEVYALDIEAQKMTVIVPPTSQPQACVEMQRDSPRGAHWRPGGLWSRPRLESQSP